MIIERANRAFRVYWNNPAFMRVYRCLFKMTREISEGTEHVGWLHNIIAVIRKKTL